VTMEWAQANAASTAALGQRFETALRALAADFRMSSRRWTVGVT
jgi:hypothetical protein